MAVSIVLAAGVGVSIAILRREAATEFFTEAVQRGPIRNVVNATGTVQALLTVQVGSQISGQVQALYADYNSVVKRGQLLAKIDPRTFQAQLEQARANLLAAQARVLTTDADWKNQQASLESSKANLQVVRVARDNTAVIFQRFVELQQGGVVSQNDYDNAKANADSAEARYAQAASQVQQIEAQVNSSKAQIEQAKAQVEQARAAMNQMQVNLDYTSIISPVDGVVVSRNVDVGQTVAASLQAPILFVIANDLTQMQVNASVDEADIGSISDAADVRFTVDAYPNQQFVGKIAEIRLNPQAAQNVVTYSVMINVDNERLGLKPGMTANITITVAQQDNVLKLPNAAMRYLPPGVTREQVAEMLRGVPVEMASLNSGQTPPAKPGDLSSGAAPEPAAAADRRPNLAPPASPGAGIEQQLRDPNLSPEQRRALVQQLSPEQRQGMRGGLGRSGAGEADWGGGPAAGGRSRQSQSQPSPAALAPGQMWDPALKIQFPTAARRSARPAIVWVLGPPKKPESRPVLLGITDGTSTQVLSGDVKEADNVIVGDTTQAAAPATQTRAPFFGGGGGPGGGFRFGGR
ncbi:MAG: HlyD family secretion protein [Acidobacteria bacterium]|nr:HlyD family secretion protein [Acidobacteriota bacterium]